MDEKLVSVIITTYGRVGDMIFEAINSVRNQSYKNIEIIVVDDNGLGTELQQANEAVFNREPDIKYIANKKNSGAQVSRNAGILSSRGEYIACLDDDDIWHPEKIEKQVAFLEANDLGMVFCNGYRFYENDLNNKKIYQAKFICDCPINYQTALRGDRIGSTSHPLMRRECFAKVGLFDTEMPARQDYEMWLRMCRHYKVQGIDEPLWYYRYHEGVRITKSYQKELRSYQLLWDKYRRDYQKDPTAKAGILFSLALTYLKMKKYGSACWFGLRSLIARPSVALDVLKRRIKGEAQF